MEQAASHRIKVKIIIAPTYVVLRLLCGTTPWSLKVVKCFIENGFINMLKLKNIHIKLLRKSIQRTLSAFECILLRTELSWFAHKISCSSKTPS